MPATAPSVEPPASPTEAPPVEAPSFQEVVIPSRPQNESETRAYVARLIDQPQVIAEILRVSHRTSLRGEDFEEKAKQFTPVAMRTRGTQCYRLAFIPVKVDHSREKVTSNEVFHYDEAKQTVAGPISAEFSMGTWIFNPATA